MSSKLRMTSSKCSRSLKISANFEGKLSYRFKSKTYCMDVFLVLQCHTFVIRSIFVECHSDVALLGDRILW